MQPLDARLFFSRSRLESFYSSIQTPQTSLPARSFSLFSFESLYFTIYFLLLRRHRERTWILASLRHQCTDSSNSSVTPSFEAHTLCAPHSLRNHASQICPSRRSSSRRNRFATKHQPSRINHSYRIRLIYAPTVHSPRDSRCTLHTSTRAASADSQKAHAIG